MSCHDAERPRPYGRWVSVRQAQSCGRRAAWSSVAYPRQPRRPELDPGRGRLTFEMRDRRSLSSRSIAPRRRSTAWTSGSSYEVGSGLFGHRRGRNIFVEDAIPNPTPPQREHSRVFIDSAYLKRGEKDFYRPRGLSWIGDWHTHPDFDSGQPNPSEADSLTPTAPTTSTPGSSRDGRPG